MLSYNVRSDELISVIVPVYNVDKYLKQCIDSIVYQTYSNLEIILVDDGSTDKSGEICDSYIEKDNRIIVIHSINNGLSDARNNGLSKSSGNLIIFIDSDDWLEADMIESLYESMLEYEAEISVCGFYHVMENGIIYDEKHNDNSINVYSKDEAINLLIHDMEIESFVWNKLMRKDLINGMLFPTRRHVQDMFVMHKYFLNANRIVVNNKAKYFYRSRETSIQGSRGLKTDLDQFTMYCLRYDDISNIYPELSKKMIYDIIYFGICAYRHYAVMKKLNKSELSQKQWIKKKIKIYYKKSDCIIFKIKLNVLLILYMPCLYDCLCLIIKSRYRY